MYHFFSRLLFIIGFLSGVFFAILTVIITNRNYEPLPKITKFPNNTNYQRWLASNRIKTTRVPMDNLRYKTRDYTLESEFLYEKVSVLCVILVRNKKNAEAAKNTWAQSCNKVQLVDLHTDKRRKIVAITKNKQDSTWKMFCNSLLNTTNSFDWILVVNDNTFALVENLRLFVAPLDVRKHFYLGHAVQFWGVNYNSGLAGYAINNSTFNKLKQKLVDDNCVTETTFLNKEDFYLGKLLSTLNIFPEDTRDPLGLTTFHSYNWQQELFTDLNFYKTSVYPVVCCSSQSITFQATEADKMYMYYYLVYQLQVFRNGNLGNKEAPTPIPQDEVWKSFLKERGIETDDISPQQYYKIWENIVHDPSEFAKELTDRKYEY